MSSLVQAGIGLYETKELQKCRLLINRTSVLDGTISMCIHIYMYACMYVCMYVSMCVNVCVCANKHTIRVRMCVCVYIYIYTVIYA